MPGIVGIISNERSGQHQSLVEAMLASMKHEQFYRSAIYAAPEMGVYAGSIGFDPADTGQIFFNERKDITLVLSGELFFDSRVGKELCQKGHQIEDQRTSWLIHLYEEKGEQFIEELNGLFSGLLIDEKQRKVILFNDRYGSERIYWHEKRGNIYFASEAKALLRILPELRTFDEQGVAQFLTYGCTFDQRTLFREVQTLPGASLWSFENGKCRRRKYFSPATWETQPVLSGDDFTSEFEETFRRIVPRYFESGDNIGISLTGGLDTRMIMACRPEKPQKPVCYTFSGERGETLDDRLAAQVARVCGLDHRLLRIGSDFFSDFSTHTDRTVYVTDGCFGAIGAHEIYLNRKAREVAPVRLTGNYGSEVLRGASTFKPIHLSSSLVNPEFNSSFDAAAAPIVDGRKHPITFTAFCEIPWNLFGSLAASRSQVRFRTPYLDNEIVRLAYRAPEKLRRSSLPAWRLIEANNTLLTKVPTDRPSRQTPGQVPGSKRFFSEATFKLDYLNNEGWPNWLSPFEPIFKRVTSSLGIIGLHKYLHYRSWFRNELASYVNDSIANARVRQVPFWNAAFLEKMATDHINGGKNYVLEINAVMTLEAVQRLLFQGSTNTVEESRQSEVLPLVSVAGREA